MRGQNNDVLFSNLLPLDQKEAPENRFISDSLLIAPWLGNAMIHNQKERLVSQRTIPFMVVNKPQGPRVKIENQNELALGPGGGLAILPQHDGSVWKF
jgi:hypothetical protein